MELATDVLLAPIVKSTISKVISAAKGQVNLVVGYKEDLRSFCATLEMAKGLLEHAEQKKATEDPGVKVWLKELRRIADEADAVVDEIVYKSLKRKATQRQMGKQVRSFFTSSNPLAVRLRTASKINDLNVALVKVNNQASGFGFQYMLANKKDPECSGLGTQTDASLGDPSLIIGREGDAKEIVRLLTESSYDKLDLGVVSIVGVGGLGKTTLAKLVCKNEQVQKSFSKIMWVCVSERFDVFSILGEMLQSLTGSDMILRNQDALVNKIKKELGGKNYLLVLDDVWNESDEEKWEALKHSLLEITKDVRGSKVLVTTRLRGAASLMGSLLGSFVGLKDDDCWEIIKQRAFRNSSVPPELEEIGRKIAIKCRGVPLVANVLGGTLGKSMNEDYWLSIEKDFDACGPLVDNGRVVRVLKLSFDRLPRPALKQCFAFCSVFPKDFVMEKEMLIQLWMAEGFIQLEDGSREMEDIGEEYFHTLVSYSFFQDVERDFYGRVDSCKIHDLMHDLAKFVSKSESLVLEDSGRSDILDIRHLNLICAPSMQPSKTVEVIQGLHSLFSKVDVPCDIPFQFKRLLVLSFCGADIDQLPGFLMKLKRLRYFDISETKLIEIPRFIGRLYHLQTFRFIDCAHINKPFEGIENLTNLKHICFDNEELMPARIGSATCLQTLPIFVVGHQDGRGIEELEHLSRLRGSLRISKLENVRNKAEATRARLCEKTAIMELDLSFSSREERLGDHDEDVLEGLKPHTNLKGLRLTGYKGENCPSWLLENVSTLGDSIYLKNLLSLDFSKCYHLRSMPSLSLSNLVLLVISECGELESIASLSLNTLAELDIDQCKNLKSVAISSLQSLKIKECGELVSVDFGSLAMESLKEIHIYQCGKLESLPRIGGSPLLGKLRLYRCANLRCIGDSGSSFASSNCLVELRLERCPSLVSVPRLDGISSLIEVGLCHRQQLESIEWENLSTSTCLKTFIIDSFDDLTHFEEESFSLPTCLKELHIGQCSALTSISLGGFTCLERLSIWNCPALVSISTLNEFTSLGYLRLTDCGLSKLPSGLSSLLHLYELRLGGFSKELEEFPDLSFMQQINSSLRRLYLYGWEKLKNLPHQLQYLTSLTHMTIFTFNGVKSLPEWLGNLSSLKILRIEDCNSLMHVPSMDAMRRLSNLEFLYIMNCTELAARCAIESGSEWEKISHIPNICIDFIYIQFGRRGRE